MPRLTAKRIELNNNQKRILEQLAQVEKETLLKLKEEIINVLSDEQRLGRPLTYTDEQVATIIALLLIRPT